MNASDCEYAIEQGVEYLRLTKVRPLGISTSGWSVADWDNWWRRIVLENIRDGRDCPHCR